MPPVHSGGLAPVLPARASSAQRAQRLPRSSLGSEVLPQGKQRDLALLKPRPAFSVMAQTRPAGSPPPLPQEPMLRAIACPGRPGDAGPRLTWLFGVLPPPC